MYLGEVAIRQVCVVWCVRAHGEQDEPIMRLGPDGKLLQNPPYLIVSPRLAHM